MTKRLLVTHVDLRFGGVERQLCYLLDGLCGSGLWDVDLLLFDDKGEMSELVPREVRTVGLGSGPAVRAKMASRVARIADRYSAVLSFHGYTNWTTAAGLIAGRRRAPLVMSIPGAPMPGRLDPMRRILGRRACAVQAVSQGVGEGVSALYRFRCPVVVIPNAVDIKAVRSARDASSAGIKMRASGLSPILCTTARLVPGKGVDTVIHALKLVRREVEAGLVVIGDGPDRERLETLVKSIGLSSAVRFVGFSARPYDELAGADMFAFGSESEGLPSVILEAMAARLPIISTRYLGGYEEVLHDGTTARLVQIGDSAAMASELMAVYRDPEESRRMVDAADALVAKYDTRNYVRSYMALLDSVTAEASSSSGVNENSEGNMEELPPWPSGA